MKVLVIYATAGAGHRMAAQAIFNGLKGRPGVESFLVDSLDHTSRYFKSIYSKGYAFVISHLPSGWAFFFALLDIPLLQPLLNFVHRVQNAIFARGLHRYLEQEKFDCIVSSHFLSTEVATYLKRKGKISSKIICTVTDFDVHRIWLAEGVDIYTVACDWTRDKMTNLQVPPERIKVTGIPTDGKFSQPRDQREIKKKLGLQENLFTVLVATGSFGIGPIQEILESLKGFQIAVVCGHNKELYGKLQSYQAATVKIFGLVNNMEELMAIADAMITKPGGLSISEALVSGLPMIFFNAIPGQETNNISVLKGYGVGLSNCPIPEMANVLRRMQSSPAELLAAKEKIRSLAKPSAVQDIIALLE